MNPETIKEQSQTAGDGSTSLTTGISEGWEERRLGNLCEKIGSGATPRGGKESYGTTGISLIRSQNVLNEGFSANGLAFINEDQAQDLDNVSVISNDVLLNITGESVARCCMVPDDVLPGRVNQHVCIIRPIKDFLDPKYLRYFFISPGMQQHMLALASSGATRQALTKGMIENFVIMCPSIREQRAIAKILSDLDEKIELNHRINKTLEAIAQALFKRWFVDFNFPDEKGRPYKNSGGKMVDSDLGKIPEGWKAGTFSDFVSNVKEPLKPGEEICDRKYVPIESLPMKQIGMIDDKSYLEAQSSLVAFEKNDILFGAMRAYFHRVNFAPYKGVTRTTTFVLRPTKLSYLSYGLFLLNLESSVHYANLHSKGSTMPYAVWENSLSEMPAVIPDEGVLDMYHRIIYPLLQRIGELSDENKTLAKIRDSLLPKLMSGKIRVQK